ncbi:hypothetical protein [Allisonella histaminiformans]|uniref:hypothetical protein n=1 Tax=Allisonella histaminiformans TaxID=209880 RepID=UPI003F8CC679
MFVWLCAELLACKSGESLFFWQKSKNICINQRFFDAYCEAHEKKFGETFVWDTNTLIV